MMINNRKKMQQIVAIVAIVGVAASGAVTFFSVAATQQNQQVQIESDKLNSGTEQEQLPVDPNAVSNQVETLTPESATGEVPAGEITQ